MELSFAPHPSHTLDENGEKVYLFPHMRSIMSGNQCLGYCQALEGKAVTLIVAVSKTEQDEIRTFVEAEFASVSKRAAPPTREQIEAIEEFLESGVEPDDDDDEEETDDDVDDEG